MVLSATEVVWHDLECGSYDADLPLWRELADRSALDPRCAGILDVGAGTGRVALHLARAGHRVTAVDLNGELLDALAERAAGMSVETVCADARTFELGRADFDLCLLPMQTVQLLGGPAERIAFLRRARAHLRPGGLLAMAIVTAVEPFDCAGGGLGPAPELARVDGVLYSSRAVRVHVLRKSVLIERERRIDPDRGFGATGEPDDGLSPAERPAERNVVELHHLEASRLELEAIGAGLEPESIRELAPTDDHVGSTVVILRA